MKSDDHGPSATVKSTGQDVVQKCFEVRELLIHGNPQGLKDARGRMRFSWPGPDDLLHELLEFVGASQGSAALPASHDFLDNSPRLGFFSIVAKDSFQFVRIRCREEFSDRVAGGSVKTHVERPGRLEAEAAFRIGQLIRRKPQIQQNSINCRELQFIEDSIQLGITGLPQHNARTGYDLSCPGEHVRIAVESNEPTGGIHLFQNLLTVSAGTDGAINDRQPCRQLQLLQDFMNHDGQVHRPF